MTERERFANRLIGYRKAIEMSQADLSKKVGKAQSVISAWEKGQSSPDVDMLNSLAKALDISIPELCGVTDANSSDQELLDAYHAADPITQKNIRLLLGLGGNDNVDK